jgi:hypothetical protein
MSYELVDFDEFTSNLKKNCSPTENISIQIPEETILVEYDSTETTIQEKNEYIDKVKSLFDSIKLQKKVNDQPLVNNNVAIGTHKLDLTLKESDSKKEEILQKLGKLKNKYPFIKTDYFHENDTVEMLEKEYNKLRFDVICQLNEFEKTPSDNSKQNKLDSHHTKGHFGVTGMVGV